MSSRAAFISAGGDPFILLTVIKLFQERYYAELDKMYVCYNNHSNVPLSVVQELLPRLATDPKIELIYHNRGIGNGRPITEMALIAQEDLVMLIEDDGFVFSSGAVNKCFQEIESDLCDALGSPRFSCGAEIGEAAQKKYGLDYSGYGDVGPNFWPNFFFCKRKDLLKTDLNFGSKSFVPGEYSKELDHTFKEVNHADTFGWGAIQLRALGVRFHNIPQHHADPYEITNKEKHEQNWHPTQSWFPWIHGGSLSTSWGGYLQGQIPDLTAEISTYEFETRVAFWTICSDVIEGFDEFKKEYRAGIAQLITQANLDQSRINDKIAIYRDLLDV